MQARDRAYSIKNKKLVRTMTFSLVLLVTAALLLSGSVSAMDLQGTSKPMNNIKKNPTWISSARDNIASIDLDPEPNQGNPSLTDYIYFDDGTNSNSLGLTAGGTFEYGIRITPTELSGYNGWELSSVRHHHGWSGSTAPSVSGFIKIYDEGTATSPGTLLLSEPYTTLAVPGWEEYTLSSPVVIDETKDIWVCLEVTHLAGEYPAGMDPGPAVDGKGDWIYLDPGPWQEIQGLGFDENWNLWAGLEEGGPGADHDVGVQSIDSPTSGPAGVIAPEVTVKNYGNNQETSVPVNMEITKLVSSTIFTEDFEDSIPSVPVFPPEGWSIVQYDPVNTWYKYSSGYARCTESSTGISDEWLITESYDCSALSAVSLSIGYIYMSTPDDEYVEILGSTDGGVTWPNTIDYIDAYGSGARAYDLSSWAAGQSNVKIAWHYYSGSTTGTQYFYFRTLKISSPAQVTSGVSEDFNGAWGTYGDNPPPGWTILDFGSESPPVWNNNDWHNYYYSTFGSNCARVYYSPYESMDEWLITPTIDCSVLTDVDLMFRQYLYFYSTYPGYGYVLGSTDNGATWTETVAYYDVSQATNYYSYDISSWAAGESQVKIAFNYVAPGAQGRYWYVDDIMVGAITPESVFYENYWFNDETTANWGPNGWVSEDVLNMDSTIPPDPNKWRPAAAGYATTPTGITPYSGSYMAIYDTGLLYPDGSMCRLYTPAMDLSGYSASVLLCKFMMYLSSYSSSYTDHVDIQVSTDGSTWTTIDTIYAYDATNPGWVQQSIDLSAYASSTSLQLGFLGVDGGYMDIVLDDITLEASSLATEYDQTVYVTVPVGGSVVATFPAWTPSDWQVNGNVDIDYNIAAETQLTGDENPANDAKTALFTLNYPYLHDIAVVSIDNPVSGTAQTLPVEVTIKNIGQFPECCYQTDVGIGSFVYDVTGIFSDFESDNGGYSVTGGVWEWGTPTSGPGAAYSGSKLWGTVLGGTYPTYANCQLISPSVTVPTDGDLTFWHWWDTEESYDGGNVKISTNGGSTWTLIYPDSGYTGTANTANPLYPEAIFSGHEQGFWEQMTFELSSYEGMSVMFRFDFGSDGSVVYPGWYIDDVLVGEVEISLVPEYSDLVCTIELDPGEEATLTFDDWTPDALALGISGGINYGIIAEQMLAVDENPDNDELTESITLDYWHDVGVQDITEPSLGRNPDVFYAFNSYPGDESIWFENTIPGVFNTIGPNTASDFICAGTWADGVWYVSDYGTGSLYTVDPTDGTMTLIGGSLAGGYNGIAYDGSTMYGATSTALYTIDLGTGASTLVGNLGSAGIMIDIAIDQDTGICYGHDIVDDNIYTIDLSTGAATILGPTGLACNYAQGMEYDQDNDILYLAGYTTQGELYTCDTTTGACTLVGAFEAGAEVCGLAIPYSGGGPGPVPIDVWLAPGTYPIEGIVENLGTFEETGLTCYAEILEFISDPNGTVVYSDDIGNIDLDPLGDETTVTFTSYDFALEGAYGLFIDFPLVNDDKMNNNEESLGIGIDDTEPSSSHTLSPATPNGQNGWYVSDLTVSLSADDGVDAWDSGVESIKYRINGGTIQTIPGDSGSFMLIDDGEGIDIEYWSVDKVGNEETPHNHVDPIDMDQTIPEVDLSYEVTGGNQWQGWELTWTATATDETSGMDRVEFYFNDVLQETVTGAGPTYTWVIQTYLFPQTYFKATAYDIAGNFASDVVENPTSHSHNNENANTQTTIVKTVLQK